MRISQEGKDEFEMNIEDDLINKTEEKTLSGDINKKRQEEVANLLSNDLMTEIHENEEDDSPSASSDEN